MGTQILFLGMLKVNFKFGDPLVYIILTGQNETKKGNNLISIPGAADGLNSCFSRFDDMHNL